MSIFWHLLSVPLLIALNAFFVAAEYAIVAARADQQYLSAIFRTVVMLRDVVSFPRALPSCTPKSSDSLHRARRSQ